MQGSVELSKDEKEKDVKDVKKNKTELNIQQTTNRNIQQAIIKKTIAHSVFY